MEWINFRHLYSFWMVFKCGGFKAASEKMHVSQSTVSEQVALLEEYFQKNLYERTTRFVKLSETGHILFKYTDQIFEKSKEINRFVRDGELEESTYDIRVGIVGGISRNLLFRLFQSAMDDVELRKIDVVNGTYDELIQMLNRFELDLFMSTQPPFGKDLINFSSEIIESSRLVLAGKKRLISSLKRNPKSGSGIDLYSFTYPYRSGTVLEKLPKTLGRRFNLRLESDDISLLRFFANSSDGVAIVPEIGIKEDLIEGRLDMIPLRGVELIDFYAIYLKDFIYKSRVEKLLESLSI